MFFSSFYLYVSIYKKTCICGYKYDWNIPQLFHSSSIQLNEWEKVGTKLNMSVKDTTSNLMITLKWTTGYILSLYYVSITLKAALSMWETTTWSSPHCFPVIDFHFIVTILWQTTWSLASWNPGLSVCHPRQFKTIFFPYFIFFISFKTSVL